MAIFVNPMKTVISSEGYNSLDLKEIVKYRGLLTYLSLRDVKVKYKQTWVGFGWAIIRPIINIAIFGTLSILIDRSGNYEDKFLEVSAGIIIWTFISTLITEVSNSMSNNSNILSKVYFPKLILPVSTILVTFVDFLISFVLFLIAYIFYKGPPSPTIFLLPFFLFFGIMICFALGLFFASASIKYRDAKFVLPFMVQILFYATPVFISSSLVLNMNIPSWLKSLYLINPFYYIVEGFRYCITGHFTYFSQFHFIIAAAIVLVLLFVSVRYFFRTEQSFVDYL
jgi:lipopolysaccharide transport system permease protein